MRILALLGLVSVLFSCAQPQQQRSTRDGDRAQVTFHVLGLQKTPSGAT